ncbi:MAG: cysteine dioxygenase family protein [Planctomycetota bacterium]
MACMSVEDYAKSVTEIIGRCNNPADVVREIVPLKKRLLENADICPEFFHRGLDDVPYTRNLLYADPEGRFTVVAIVWGAAKGSPVHDHQTWGVVGVLKETIDIIDYDAPSPDGSLSERSRCTAAAGEVLEIVPPREHNIHRMANSCSTPCLTIHTYGDPAKICRVYDPKSGSTTDRNLTFHNNL